MRRQTQERVSAGVANVGVTPDARWSVQPHRWNFYPGLLAASFGPDRYGVSAAFPSSS